MKKNTSMLTNELVSTKNAEKWLKMRVFYMKTRICFYIRSYVIIIFVRKGNTK